jgi:hypothetical protein
MRNKRIAAAFILLATLAFGLSAAGAGPEGDTDAADVVVLLDLSQSTLPYFQDVTDYVVSSVVQDYLRKGDTFHLLSFGETAQTEIAQRVTSEADVKSVLGRIYLLYPLARYSDFVGALSYLYQYLADLPESRRKVVVVITDGVHNPPPSGPTYGMSPDKVAAEIESAASRIRANGWPVRIIKLPFPKPGEPGAPALGSAEAQGRSYIDETARTLGADVSEFSHGAAEGLIRKSLALPRATFPGPLGKKDYAFSFPLKIENGAASPVGLELDRVRLGDADILTKKAFLTLQGGKSGGLDVPVLLPESLPEGPSKLAVSLHFANGVRVSPDLGVLELNLERNPFASFLRSGARIALFIIVLALGIAAVLALVLIVKRMPKKAEGPIAAAVLQAEADSVSASSASATAAAVGSASAGASSAEALRGTAKRGAKAAPARSGASSTAIGGGSQASEVERNATAAASVQAMADERRAEALRSAALLAEASGRRDSEAASVSPAERRKDKVKPTADDHEAAIESTQAAIALRMKEESTRSAALLAEASGRHAPAKASSAADAASARAAAASYSARIVKPGSISVEFLVAEQNPHIGSRNVHVLSAGGSKTVGGGSSDFLIFLVSVPRKSAEIHFDGEKLTFIPLRPELFPELSGPIEDCLGVDIPMISRSGYPMKLRFALYEKPADKINRLLHCIETPGL